MATVPVAHGLLLAGLLFVLGVLGLLVRRNVVFVLLSLEIMLNAAGLAFIVAGARWGQTDGQVMFILVLTTAAAELAVGLSLALRFRRHFKSLDPGAAGTMRG